MNTFSQFSLIKDECQYHMFCFKFTSILLTVVPNSKIFKSLVAFCPTIIMAKYEDISLQDMQQTLSSEKGTKVEEGALACQDFDDVLEIVGSTSTYQRIFLYGILFPLTIFEAVFSYNLWFLMDEPDHWCYVPGRNETPEETDLLTWKNLTIPRDPDNEGKYSKCRMFSENGSSIACTSGWEYDFSIASYKSIVVDFDWVCDKSHYSTWVLTGTLAGCAIGTFFLGHLADKIGRKPVFIITLVIFSAGRAVSLYFVDVIWVFVGFGLLTGMSSPMFAMSVSTICLELSGKEYLTWIYSFTWMTVVIGVGLIPAIALLSPNWFVFGWTTIILGSLSYLFIPVVPESPRWLLSKGRIDEVVVILRNIAKWNNTSHKITDDKLRHLLEQVNSINKSSSESQMSVLKLFSKRRLAIHTLLITFSWIMNNLVFSYLTLNSLNLAGHRYLNFFLVSLAEVPGSFLGGFLSDKFGRRWAQSSFFFMCGMGCIVAGIFSAIGGDTTTSAIVIVAADNFAKIAITMSFLVIYLQAAEVFPTPLRTTGSGFASTTASITLIIVPYIVYTGKSDQTTAWAINSILSFAGMLAAAFIPETRNFKLPETLEEADNFGKGRKFWSFRVPQTTPCSACAS